MSRKFLIGILILPALALCAILPNSLDNNDTWQGSVIFPVLPSPENSSFVLGNTSFEKILKIRCDPVRYGRRLKVESCRKVFNYMDADDAEIVFADRSNLQPHDVNLPFRDTSSEWLRILTLGEKSLWRQC